MVLKHLGYNKTIRLFFDFYVMNEVWFKTIGRGKLGYTNKIIPSKKEEIIENTFNSIISEMKQRVIDCLEKSVRGEIKHFDNNGPERNIPFKYNDIDNYYHCKNVKLIKNFIKKYGRRSNKWSLQTIRDGFLLNKWDECYGGKKWAKATELLIKLKNSKSITDDIYFIDRIFDLQHNTGFVLDKTYFKFLKNYFLPIDLRRRYKIKHRIPLNFRFAGKIEDMVNLASSKVYKIYMANKNYLIAS